MDDVPLSRRPAGGPRTAVEAARTVIEGARSTGDGDLELPVELLAAGDSPRSAGVDPHHAAALAAAPGPLPPIIVHWPTLRVIDGMHRLAAARARGDDLIPVRLFEGGESDAFVLAVGENAARGLPLTLADRKRAAARIIRSFPRWSARRVAAVTGLSAGTVTEIRKDELGDGPDGDARIGRDGRVRPVDKAEGRDIARRLIVEDPTLSLRQIARVAGISPETVRTLKHSLLNGPSAPADQAPEPAAEPAAGETRTTAATAVPGRDALMERLKADPALRFRESGRDLLRLLSLTSLSPADWERLVAAVPSGHRAAIVQLARDCAAGWTEFAALATGIALPRDTGLPGGGTVGAPAPEAVGDAGPAGGVQVRGLDSWTRERRQPAGSTRGERGHGSRPAAVVRRRAAGAGPDRVAVPGGIT
ncbi:streptomycin biosynthesis protein [Actinomadura soli]|uniref:Streptomycin biosynthesis protein n=1 Tax=Actinomadura soli TaxID=2508997 RepID=A0A5C4JK36_9ACTN|nr:ParB N-terminal domain-containing protein [Actinomadura soli]TMR07238.1 streptomycin biosynthesis protein [Actinomadura soli]